MSRKFACLLCGRPYLCLLDSGWMGCMQILGLTQLRFMLCWVGVLTIILMKFLRVIMFAFVQLMQLLHKFCACCFSIFCIFFNPSLKQTIKVYFLLKREEQETTQEESRNMDNLCDGGGIGWPLWTWGIASKITFHPNLLLLPHSAPSWILS